MLQYTFLFFTRSFLWREERNFQNYLRFHYFSDATFDELVYCSNTHAMDQSVKSLCNFKKHRSPIANLFFVDKVRFFYVRAHFTRTLPRLIFSSRVPYICLVCLYFVFPEFSAGPRPRDRFYHATALQYYRKRISEAIHARKVVVSGQRAHSISPSSFSCFLRSGISPSTSIPADYVRPQPRLATFARMSFRAASTLVSRTSFELRCQA